MSGEEWVQEATGDDAMVAELLLLFKQVKPKTEAAGPPAMTSKRALSVEWTVRQRRSKAVMVQSKKQAPSASPTTPLSWSGATSVSGGGGGGGRSRSGCGGAFDGGPEEDSSRPSPPPPPPKRSDTPRSKVFGTSETTSTKRSRRKKTLAELKEEEDLLQKERRQLKRELVTLRLNLEKARATNENLKRMKLELQTPPAAESASIVSSELAISDQLQQKRASVDPIPAILPSIVAGSLQCSPPNGCSEVEEEVTAGKFVLPDLNLPFDETSNADIMCGVS